MQFITFKKIYLISFQSIENYKRAQSITQVKQSKIHGKKNK